MPLKAGKPRKKKCANRECRAEFQPERSFQSWCSTDCAVIIARAKQARASERKAKAERAEHRAKKESFKTRRDYLREAQAVVNRYVRLRDAHLGCVSCDKGPDWDGQWHASHFRSVKAAPQLRFNVMNIHKSCGVCNNHLSGNILGYRPELIRRLGEARVEWIESFNEIIRYDIEYLKRLKKVFSRRCRIIEARMDGMLSGRMRPRRTIQVSSAMSETLLSDLEEWLG